jgi:delta-aminolevulinic acid dehydratase/porphobilinogen synthase
VFVLDGQQPREAVASMPGVERLSLDLLLPVAEDCVKLGIPVMALFPVIDASLKTPTAARPPTPTAWCRAWCGAEESASPGLGVMTDVALDPFTSHGQDGLLDETGYILNDETVEVLVQQALTQAEAGVDIVAPSDMMDGRIGAIRRRWRPPATSTPASWPTAPSTPAPSTARSATRWARPATWARATRRSTRWTPATATRRCARWRWTSPKAPTW